MNYKIMILCFILNLLICIGIPILAFIYLTVKKRRYLKSFLIGVLVFVVSQVILRIPLINIVLANTSWYGIFSTLYPVTYSIFLGITAGIFEECGRYVGFTHGLKENRTYKDGIAFALGHGGIEALLLGGIASLFNLIILIYINSGATSGSILGVDIQTVINTFSSVSYLEIMTGGIERIFAMCIHLGLTMIVLYGINKKKISYLVLAILIHSVVDAVVAALSSFGFSIIVIEGWCLICAILFIVFTIKIKKRFKEV